LHKAAANQQYGSCFELYHKKITNMCSRYLLIGLAIAIMPHCMAQQKKAVKKTAKTVAPQKRVTEAEAKRIHVAQLAKEGAAGTRRAYKRSEMEQLQHVSQNDAATARAKTPEQPASKPVAVKNQSPAKQPAGNTVKSEPKEPKFIEGIVLERQRK
jgi:hypothetical protein